MDEFTIYTAGLVDGEGSICIHRTVPPKNTTSPLPRYRLHIYINMCNREAIDRIQAKWGGSINLHRNNRPNQRDSYQWNIMSIAAMNFLKDILPYLIIKKVHAELGIEFQTHLTESGSARYVGQGLKRLPLESTLVIRDGFYERMKLLNMRGRAK